MVNFTTAVRLHMAKQTVGLRKHPKFRKEPVLHTRANVGKEIEMETGTEKGSEWLLHPNDVRSFL